MTALMQWVFPEGMGEGSLRERILRSRGLTQPRDQELFASPLPPLSLLREPATLPGADLVAAALDGWMREGLQIAIFGDYDADGLCAAAILSRLLRQFGSVPRVVIPHRVDHGYGLHADSLRQLQAEGVQAVITVDCGIRSFAEAELAAHIGLRLIVTDHHRVEREADGTIRLPRAEAVAHPHLGGCPFEHISGSVVAFKVAKRLIRLRGGERPPDVLRQWVVNVALPLAAMGLVPDVMPLLDENRVLVAHAVKLLPTCGLPGIHAMLREAGIDLRSMNASTISHQIGPRLNALGRLEGATDALRLLDTDDQSEARTVAKRLEAVNNERKTLTEELARITQDRAVKEGFDSASRCSIVMADPQWHPGLLGLAAARLVDRYQKPVVLFGGESSLLKASGRAPQGIDLHACLEECPSLFASFGGHAAAVGGSMTSENVSAFAQALEAVVRTRTDQGMVAARSLPIDASMPIEQAMACLPEIESLQPFGKDFAAPLIHCGNLVVRSAATMGRDGAHLKVQVHTKGSQRSTGLLMWRQGNRVGEFRVGRSCEVVGTPKASSNPRFDSDFEIRDFRLID